jgi:hypothetical protein
VNKIVFLDTETTSLRPDRRAWEIGMIYRELGQKDQELSWMINACDLDLGNADLMSLKIGKFYERHAWGNPLAPKSEVRERDALESVEAWTRDATIVGAVPSFDTELLAVRMRAHGIVPSWKHRLRDIESMAVGATRKGPNIGLNDVMEIYGLAYPEEDRHTALGDARMVRDLYDCIMSSDPA